MKTSRAAQIVGVALAALLTFGALPIPSTTVASTAVASTAAWASSGSHADPVARIRKAIATRADLRGRLARAAENAAAASAEARTATGAVTATAAPAPAPGSFSFSDALYDADEPNDASAVGARLTTHSLRLTAVVPKTPNPKTDLGWRFRQTGPIWYLDAGADGSVEKFGILFTYEGHLISAILGNTTNPNVLCAGAATYEAGGRLGMQVPTACVGSPSKIAIALDMVYDYRPGSSRTSDWVPDTGLTPAVAIASSVPGTSGALVLDAGGKLHKVKVGGSSQGATMFESLSVANPRGVAVTPDGGHGYILDGAGGLHGFGVGVNDTPPPVYGNKKWPGQNVARGVAVRPNGSAGLVVDAYGGLFTFGIGGKRAAPKIFGAPKWPGVDMARGVAVLPNGLGGFVLNAFGGLHWFSIGMQRAAPAVIGAASFPLNDAARGVTILPDGTGGFVVDKTGKMHWFSIGTPRAKPAVAGGPSWPGADLARGVTTLTRLISWPVAVVSPVVPVSGKIEDVVIDPAGQLAYAVVPAANRIVVINLATRKQVATITTGALPSGLDITPDGTKLYVALRGTNTVAVINVATRTEINRLTLPAAFEDHPVSIVIMANGKAFLSAEQSSLGAGGAIKELDLATGTFTARTTHLLAIPNAVHLRASGDRTKLGFTGAVGSYTTVYDTATDTFTTKNLDMGSTYSFTMNGNGSRILIDGKHVYDGQMNFLRTLDGPWFSYTGALAATGRLGYRPFGQTLQEFDTNSRFPTGNYDLADTSEASLGQVVISANGLEAVVVTDHGIAVVHL